MTDRSRICREIGCPFVTGAGMSVAGSVVHEPRRSGQPMQQQSRDEAQEIERARQAALDDHDQPAFTR